MGPPSWLSKTGELSNISLSVTLVLRVLFLVHHWTVIEYTHFYFFTYSLLHHLTHFYFPLILFHYSLLHHLFIYPLFICIQVYVYFIKSNSTNCIKHKNKTFYTFGRHDIIQPLTQFNEEVSFSFFLSLALTWPVFTWPFLLFFLSMFLFFELGFFIFWVPALVSFSVQHESLATLGVMTATFVDEVESRLLNTELVLLHFDNRCLSMSCLT